MDSFDNFQIIMLSICNLIHYNKEVLIIYLLLYSFFLSSSWRLVISGAHSFLDHRETHTRSLLAQRSTKQAYEREEKKQQLEISPTNSIKKKDKQKKKT